MVIQYAGIILFLFYAFGIAAVILIFLFLWNIRKAGILRPLIKIKRKFNKKSIRTVPQVFANVGQVSSNVRQMTDKPKILVPAVFNEAEYVTIAAIENSELADVKIWAPQSTKF